MWLTLLNKFLIGASFKGVATFAGCFGLAALPNTLLTKLLDRRTDRLKDDRNVTGREKERQHEKEMAVLKYASEETQLRMKHRHEKDLALITARAQEGKSVTLAA